MVMWVAPVYYLDHITPGIERDGKSVRSAERSQCLIGVRTDAEFFHFILFIIHTFSRLARPYLYIFLFYFSFFFRGGKIDDDVEERGERALFFFRKSIPSRKFPYAHTHRVPARPF